VPGDSPEKKKKRAKIENQMFKDSLKIENKFSAYKKTHKHEK
jgi:hypothetical protein